MAIKSLLSVSIILHYTKGFFRFPWIRTSSTNERLYEFGDAVNSLQDEEAKFIDKALKYRIAYI